MPKKTSPFPDLRRRLERAEDRAQPFQAEGLPIPTAQYLTEFEEAVRAGNEDRAAAVVKRAEALLARADQDWRWLNELLQRVDGLRGIADMVGLDLARIDSRVGNPRAQLLGAALTPASLEKAAAGASFALAVLDDAIPKYIVAEAQALGVSIRRARDRGEEVRDAVTSFTALVRSLQEPVLAATAGRLVEARRAVARIPRAPPVAAITEEEEDEILREARNLARRLHRIKTRAHDATDAVRLMSQVRQALSEDRRYASPEEEVEALWAEVDRLTREKRLAAAGPTLENAAPAAGPELAEASEDELEEEFGPEPGEGLASSETEDGPAPRRPLALPAVPPTPAYVPPVADAPARRPPMVPPVPPLPDERAGVASPQSPDSLSEGAGPRVPRPTRIAIAAAYVPPDLTASPFAPGEEPPGSPPAPPEETSAPPEDAEPAAGPEPVAEPSPPAEPEPAAPTPAAAPAPEAVPEPVAAPTPAPGPEAEPRPPAPATSPTRRVRSRHRQG